MKRDEILKQAETLINGDRAKDYGDAFDNFGRIAARKASISNRLLEVID